MLIVSHDRYFINKIADRILLLTNNGVKEYLGNYDYYLERTTAEKSGAVPTENKKDKKEKRRMITFCKSKSRVKNAKDRLSLKRQRLKLSDLTKKSPKHRSSSQARKLPQITKNLWSFQNCSRICKTAGGAVRNLGRTRKYGRMTYSLDERQIPLA